MTLAHFVYVPGIFIMGIVMGYVLGGRAAEAARADLAEGDRRKAARRARRLGGD